MWGRLVLRRVNSWIFSESAEIWPCSWVRLTYLVGFTTLRLSRYPSMASIFIAHSNASARVAILYCMRGIQVRGNNPCINHFLWWSTLTGFTKFHIASLNLWLYSHVDSSSLFFMSHNSIVFVSLTVVIETLQWNFVVLEIMWRLHHESLVKQPSYTIWELNLSKLSGIQPIYLHLESFMTSR
jgi:hypothetical protein